VTGALLLKRLCAAWSAPKPTAEYTEISENALFSAPLPLHHDGFQERCPSGLRSTLGKRVPGKLGRGFESHPLRHTFAVSSGRSSFESNRQGVVSRDDADQRFLSIHMSAWTLCFLQGQPAPASLAVSHRQKEHMRRRRICRHRLSQRPKACARRSSSHTEGTPVPGPYVLRLAFQKPVHSRDICTQR
jgi:hypothetical protein